MWTPDFSQSATILSSLPYASRGSVITISSSLFSGSIIERLSILPKTLIPLYIVPASTISSRIPLILYPHCGFILILLIYISADLEYPIRRICFRLKPFFLKNLKTYLMKFLSTVNIITLKHPKKKIISLEK